MTVLRAVFGGLIPDDEGRNGSWWDCPEWCEVVPSVFHQPQPTSERELVIVHERILTEADEVAVVEQLTQTRTDEGVLERHQFVAITEGESWNVDSPAQARAIGRVFAKAAALMDDKIASRPDDVDEAQR